MVEQAAEDYAKIFQSLSPEREVSPLCSNIEDMLARLDEFETLLTNVKAETNGILGDHVKSILSFSDNFEDLRKRIDNLEQFVSIVNKNLLALEHSVDVAEEELHVSDYSLKGFLLKPLLAKAKAVSATIDNAGETRSNLRNGEFQALSIFSTSHYFVDSARSLTDRFHEKP